METILEQAFQKRERAWKIQQQFSKFHELAEDSSVRSNYILSNTAGRRRQAFNFSTRRTLGPQSLAQSFHACTSRNSSTHSGPSGGHNKNPNLESSNSFPLYQRDQLLEHEKELNSFQIVKLEHHSPSDDKGPSRPTNKINGKFQSPINLASDDAIYDPTLAESPLRHHYQLTADFELINTGYILQLSLRPRQISTPQPNDAGTHEGFNGFSQRSFRSQTKLGQESILTGGPLEPNSEYQLIDVIFHWGKDEKRGSEHTVNFKSYPMEVQLIHWNCTLYSSYEEAMGKEHGICICALFVQIGNENPTINSIIEHLVDISFGGFSKRITSEHKFTLNPSTFLPDPTLRDYWVYPGSLTIPPCHENVTWILYRYPLTVSPKQRMAFCNLLTITKGQGQAPIAGNEGQMVDNFRPNQALCGRKIKSSFKP